MFRKSRTKSFRTGRKNGLLSRRQGRGQRCLMSWSCARRPGKRSAVESCRAASRIAHMEDPGAESCARCALAVVRFTLMRSCALPSHIFPSGLSRDCIGRTSSLDSIPMRHEPFRYLACTHCGTQSSYPIRLIEQYSGRIARRCETCGLVFDIQIPLKRES